MSASHLHSWGRNTDWTSSWLSAGFPWCCCSCCCHSRCCRCDGAWVLVPGFYNHQLRIVLDCFFGLEWCSLLVWFVVVRTLCSCNSLFDYEVCGEIIHWLGMLSMATWEGCDDWPWGPMTYACVLLSTMVNHTSPLFRDLLHDHLL